MKFARAVLLVAAAVLAAVATIACAAQLGQLAEPTRPPGTEAPAPAPADPGDPVRVTIPAIGVDAPLVPVGLLGNGAMQTPDFGHAGWYRPGPRPGEPGPAVVVAHVDSAARGPDVFHRLRDLRPGDQVTVHFFSATPRRLRVAAVPMVAPQAPLRDTTTTFTVTGAEQTAKTELPTTRIWNPTTDPVLRLITCGGAFDRAAGSYLDNVIVYADRLG